MAFPRDSSMQLELNFELIADRYLVQYTKDVQLSQLVGMTVKVQLI